MTPEELYRKFPVKYSRDGNDRRTIGTIAEGLADLIESGASKRELAD